MRDEIERMPSLISLRRRAMLIDAAEVFPNAPLCYQAMARQMDDGQSSCVPSGLMAGGIGHLQAAKMSAPS